MLFSTGIRKKITEIIDSYQPELIIADTLRTGQFIEDYDKSHATKILYMDDLFSIRYKKMISVIETYRHVHTNPLGSFSRFVPKYFGKIAEIKWFQKKLLAFESRVIEKRERQIVNYFHKSLLINKNEVEHLKQQTNRSNIYEIRPLLNQTSSSSRRYRGSKDFIFLGALDLPQNDISLIYFIESQIDNIIKQIPEFKLRIIGKNPSAKLLSLSVKYKDYIVLEGYVEDLSELFETCCAQIIPLLFGSGVKLKTLEAFSLGLPVISTEYGVEGINVQNRIHCIIENNLGQFPEIMREVCDCELNLSLSNNSKKLFAEQYSKQTVFELYDRLFNRGE
jgi:glycosyltransferase involved in cell wall biosynthesis